MMRDTSASPILFSMMVPSHSLLLMKNWFCGEGRAWRRREERDRVSSAASRESEHDERKRAHLDVDEVVRELDRLDVGVLDRVLDVRDAHRPRADRAADLDLARARDTLALELLGREVGRRDEERHLDRVVLGAQEVVPALHEVAAQVASGLADDLQADVVPACVSSVRVSTSLLCERARGSKGRERERDAPRLTRDLAAVVHVLLGLVERVEVEHALVRVVLARPDLRLGRLVVAHLLAVDAVLERVGPIVGQDVARRVPPPEAQVEAAHEADRLVDDAHLLVLRARKRREGGSERVSSTFLKVERGRARRD